MLPTWFLVAICIACWGAWAVTEKLSLRQMSPLMVIIIGMYAYSALAPLLWLYAKARGLSTDVTSGGIAWSLLTCVLATVAGLSFIHAIQRAHVHLVVGFTSTYPIVTFALCAIFLGEPVTAWKLLGIAAICCGTVLLAL